MEINTKEFKNLIFDFEKDCKYQGKKNIILDFYADWCQPCKVIAKTLAELEKDFPKVECYKINSEEEYSLNEFFKIRNLPTLVFIPIKGEPKIISGNFNKNKLESMIREQFNLQKAESVY